MLGMALLTVGSCKKESRNNAVTWSSNPHLAMSSGTNSSQPTKEEPPQPYGCEILKKAVYLHDLKKAR